MGCRAAPTPTWSARAPAPPVAVAPPPPAPPAVPRLVVEDGEIYCPSRRCRVEVKRFSGALKLHDAPVGSTVNYVGPGGLSLAAVDRALRAEGITIAQFATEKAARDLLRLPVSVAFPDGTRFEGAVPVSLGAVRFLLGTHFEAATETSRPGAAREAPRAMWIPWGEAGGRLRGQAPSLADVDWVLIVREKSRSVRCGANTGSVTDVEASLYALPKGPLVAEKTFPSTADPCGPSTVGMLDARAAADWAWNEVRPAKHPAAPETPASSARGR
ncbi:MAG: hypothetical protein AAGA56_13415 [Myxococcota bacterium]